MQPRTSDTAGMGRSNDRAKTIQRLGRGSCKSATMVSMVALWGIFALSLATTAAAGRVAGGRPPPTDPPQLQGNCLLHDSLTVSTGAASSPDALDPELNHGASNAVDENEDTYWDQVDGVEAPWPHILQLDGPAAFAGYTFTAYEANNYAPKTWTLTCYDVWGFAKEIHAQTDYDYTVSSGNSFSVCLDAPHTCSKVQLRISAWYGGSPAIRELKLHPHPSDPSLSGPGCVDQNGLWRPCHLRDFLGNMSPLMAGSSVEVTEEMCSAFEASESLAGAENVKDGSGNAPNQLQQVDPITKACADLRSALALEAAAKSPAASSGGSNKASGAEIARIVIEVGIFACLLLIAHTAYGASKAWAAEAQPDERRPSYADQPAFPGAGIASVASVSEL